VVYVFSRRDVAVTKTLLARGCRAARSTCLFFSSPPARRLMQALTLHRLPLLAFLAPCALCSRTISATSPHGCLCCFTALPSTLHCLEHNGYIVAAW